LRPVLRLAAPERGRGRFRASSPGRGRHGGLPQPLGGPLDRSACDRGRGRGGRTSVASAPSRWLSRDNSFPFTETPTGPTGSWRWPVGGSPRPHPLATRVTGGQCLPLQRNAPARMAASSRSSPRRWVAWWVCSRPHPVTAWLGSRPATRSGCWRAAGNRPRTPGQASSEDRLGLAGSSYLERIHGRVTGRPPRTDLPWSAACRPCCREAIKPGPAGLRHDLSDGGPGGGAGRVLSSPRAWGPKLWPCRLATAAWIGLLFAEGGAAGAGECVAGAACRSGRRCWPRKLAGSFEPRPARVPAHRSARWAARWAGLQISAGGAAQLGEAGGTNWRDL